MASVASGMPASVASGMPASVASGMPDMLALPSGEAPVEAPRNQLSLAALVASAGGAMLFGGLIAAYLVLRSNSTWPPKGVRYDNYTAATLVVTVILASITIEWAAHAIRHDQRPQALAGLGLTLGLVLAFVNGGWYLVSSFNFKAASSPYATVAHTMAFLAVVNGLIGLVFVVMTTLRAIGHQLTMANYQVMRSTALYWHFVTVASVAVYYTLYVTK